MSGPPSEGPISSAARGELLCRTKIARGSAEACQVAGHCATAAPPHSAVTILDECNAPRMRARATISYNSCRNRHCPKCQTAPRTMDRRTSKRTSSDAIRPVVFTRPSQAHALVLQNKKSLRSAFRAVRVETLSKSLATPDTSARTSALHRAAQPGIRRSGAPIPIVHCVYSCPMAVVDHTNWIKITRSVLSSLSVLRRVSAASLLLLSQALSNGQLNIQET